MNKTRVYIPNHGCHDFNAAKQFGELVYLTRGRLKLSSVGIIYREMYEVLKNSSPNDHLLICGPIIANVVATEILVSLHGKVNTLIYLGDNNAQGMYLSRTISSGGNNL